MKTYRGLFASPSPSVASSVRHQTNRFCCGIYRGDTNKVSRRERKCAVFLVFLHWNIYGNRISFFFSHWNIVLVETQKRTFRWIVEIFIESMRVRLRMNVCRAVWVCVHCTAIATVDGVAVTITVTVCVCVDIFFVSTINSILFSIHVRFTYVMLLLLHIHSILCVSVVIECVVM